MIGQSIKGFEIIARIGNGGMGEVWLAEQPLIKTKVAIKLLLPQISADTNQVKRFFNEAVAAAKIPHAGIVNIFDVGFHEGRAFLIMQYLEGTTLAARIARTKGLGLREVAELGGQMASVLAATHAVGITHRDLKPDNVFLIADAELASKERVKILDFGIAKLHGTNQGITASGSVMGTPAYMAPEQWTDLRNVDARADVYSLGCMLFEMCTGRPPFLATSIGEACSKHMSEAPPRVATIATGLPSSLDDLLGRMLAKDAASRPTLDEVGKVLTAILDGPPPRAPSTTKKAWWLAGAGAVSAIGIGALVVARSGSSVVADANRSVADAPRPDAAVDAPAPAPPPRPAAPAANAWVRIDPPRAAYVLGIADAAPGIGFRPAQHVMTPNRPFEIQQHEVTWAELDPWLARTGAAIERPAWAADASAREHLPATGVTWTSARAYCVDEVHADLPTEEQWEYAARGPDRLPNPWGSAVLDVQLTNAYRGPSATPVPVMTSAQDQIAHAGERVFDLAGNAQEWTLDLWRDERPDSFNQSSTISIRAIRGFPMAAPLGSAIQRDGAAYREKLCATGPCVAHAKDILRYVGFRCARWLDR